MTDSRNITVLGAGVSGLTTAIVLAEKGYQVKIITKELPKNTTSAVAAAIWFPYEAFPENKVSTWSYHSFREFEQLSQIEGTGVSFIPFTTYLDSTVRPWWLDALPETHILEEKVKSPVNPAHVGYKLKVPLIETPIYLPYLWNRFKAAGGEVIQKEIKQVSGFEADKIIVNCTGLGSGSLFKDELLYPIQGQVVKVEPSSNIKAMATEYPMGKDGDEIAYVIPRQDCIVLGGSAKKNRSATTPDSGLTDRIISYCADFQPAIKSLNIRESIVGLRPGRPEIRVEKDPNLPVIHNYGHGGAGFTVSWGCAREVLKIL
ncbi:FAD-dependent oxidoreductase [Gracilimonas tropica]|uniref:FAD-dependent oxidoreductase n=1 Tax=Gracilimonas tropica TaxID=454600 RepID=UPI000360A56B|nr:FAD-dependent oxidoreductase [Gracilimonas tropica]